MNKVELIILAALVLTVLMVGGKKLPELARGVGEAARELKKGFRDDDDKKDKEDEKKSDKKS